MANVKPKLSPAIASTENPSCGMSSGIHNGIFNFQLHFIIERRKSLP